VSIRTLSLSPTPPVPSARTKTLSSKPSQIKVLTGGGDMREAQVDVPLSVSHSCVSPHCWAQ